MPSTERIFKLGLASVAALSMCPTQSVPALVDRAYWNGAHSFSNAFMNCFASALATKRRSVQPVAMPLIPPSGFDNAVSRALVDAALTSSGTLPCAIWLQTATKKSVASQSFRRSFSCSHVRPPGPPEKPRGELHRLSKNVLWSNSRLGFNVSLNGYGVVIVAHLSIFLYHFLSIFNRNDFSFWVHAFCHRWGSQSLWWNS